MPPLTAAEYFDRLRRKLTEHSITVSGLSEVSGVQRALLHKYIAGWYSPRGRRQQKIEDGYQEILRRRASGEPNLARDKRTLHLEDR